MRNEMSICSTGPCGGAVKELKHKFTLEESPKTEKRSRFIEVLIL
jgi:hypothetical protein